MASLWDHRQPQAGDHGLQYAPREQASDEFNEADHPRDEDGKFGSGGGGSFERGGEAWEYGSGKVPTGSVWEESPFPKVDEKSNPLVVLGSMRTEPFDNRKLQTTNIKVKDLHAWQGGIEPEKLRPTPEDIEPITVYKINDKYIIGNGNHRATSAYVQGRETIPAKVVDFNDPKNKKYWKRGMFPQTSDEFKEDQSKSGLNLGRRPKASLIPPTPEQQRQAVDGLRQWNDLLTKMGQPKGKLMNEHGRAMLADEATYLGKRGTLHQCYANAGEEVLFTEYTGRGADLVYCEGQVSCHGVPIDHAWLLNKKTGKIIDPTIRDAGGVGGYLGIPFKASYLRKTISRTQVWGIFHHKNPQVWSDDPEDYVEKDLEIAHDAWNEADHPRGGNPANPGEFSVGRGPEGKLTHPTDYTEDHFIKAGVNLGGEKESLLKLWNEYYGEDPAELKRTVTADIPGSTMRVHLKAYSATLSVYGFLGKPDMEREGGEVGEYNFGFSPKEQTGEFEFMELKNAETGRGIAKKVVKAGIEAAQKMGIKKMDIHANLDVGGYAWAKYGWVPNNRDWAIMCDRLKRRLPERVSALLDKADPTMIWVLADSKYGKDILLGTEWHGSLYLDEPIAMERFNDYVGRNAPVELKEAA